MSNATKFHQMAAQAGIPPRTLDDVRAALAEAAKRNTDTAMAQLMLRHGRLTPEAREYTSKAATGRRRECLL